MIEILKQRRSTRKFTDEKVADEAVEKMIKAALLGPTSMNKKPVELIVVKEKNTLEKLAVCKKLGTIALKTAPLAIVVIADAVKSDVWVEDASIASILIQLEAEKLGLGSAWVQMRNRQAEDMGAEIAVRKVLNIPENYGVLSVITIGHKNENKEAYDESALDFTKVHYENF